MKAAPKGPEAARLRQRKFSLVRQFQLPEDLLPGAGHTDKEPCWLGDPLKDAKGEVHGCLHHCIMISVVGTGLTLPVDVEP